MKTTKSIIVVVFVLLMAQMASAYYCPSTGRWLSRDPIGELGFETLRAASVVVPVARPESQPARWVNRDPILELISEAKSKSAPKCLPNQNIADLYVFVANDPIINLDNLGLFTSSCASAPPLKSTDCACDAYGNEKYPLLGVNLKCFCKCAGDSPWAQAVRGCLACSHAHGDNVTLAHYECYRAATAKYGMSAATLSMIGNCYVSCGGYVPPPPPTFNGGGGY
jgi:hypothetical protein